MERTTWGVVDGKRHRWETCQGALEAAQGEVRPSTEESPHTWEGASLPLTWPQRNSRLPGSWLCTAWALCAPPSPSPQEKPPGRAPTQQHGSRAVQAGPSRETQTLTRTREPPSGAGRTLRLVVLGQNYLKGT